MKICAKCGKGKPVLAFSKNASRKDGRSQHCGECRRIIRHQWYERHKSRIYERNKENQVKFNAWFDSLKDKPCKDCKKKYPPYVMDFDHIREKKDGNLATMKFWGNKEKILREVKKCELVCSNCHRIRTGKRLGVLV